jgi:hypothetical protein
MSLILSGSDGLSDIDGSASTPAIRGTDANTGIFFPAADTIAFAEGGAESMRIDSRGNVGIAVVPEAWTLFKVIQFNEQGAVGGTSASSQLFLNTYYDGAYKFIGTGYAQRYYQATGAHVWETSNASGSADGAITFVERARIDSSGNLLIGTTTAEGRATIRGSTSDSTAFTFSTEAQDGTDQLRVRCDGAVYMGLDGSSPYNLTNGSAANAVLLSDGYLYRSTSSLRYKRDIRDLTHGLAKVLELRSVTYKGISPSDGENVYGGFIAEEVHAAGLTEFVQYDNEGQPDALHYGNMVALMAKAIQELKAELDTVKTQNAAFEARLAALEAK